MVISDSRSPIFRYPSDLTVSPQVRLMPMGKSFKQFSNPLLVDDYRGLYYLVGGLEHEFYDFPYIGNNNPNLLIFFRGVEITNQLPNILGITIFQERGIPFFATSITWKNRGVYFTLLSNLS